MEEDRRKRANEARAARRAERTEEEIRHDNLLCAFGAEGLKQFCEEWTRLTAEIRLRKNRQRNVGRRCRT